MYLIDLPPQDMRRRLGEALSVYVDAMRYPRGTEDNRASMWLEHTRRTGWKAVAAVDDTRPPGTTGPAAEATALADAPLLPEITRLMTDYFELTELHIHPEAQGRGIGEATARRLLDGRDEALVLLSTPEIHGAANRAWRLYRRLGFTDVIRDYHFAGDPRPFAVLGRALPLSVPESGSNLAR